MDKIIRGEVKLSKKECFKIGLSFKYLNEHEKYPLEEISKKIRLKGEKNFELRLVIKKVDEQTYLSISYLDKIIFLKECYIAKDVLGIYVLRKLKGYIFLINVDFEWPEKEYYEYYHRKLYILKFKIDDNIKEMYNQIMYYDFTNENELLMATYCLFLLLPYASEYMYAFGLYKKKLNYIGFDVKDFHNKNNKYYLNEIERIIKENNSLKDILTYLIGLVTSIKGYDNEIYKNRVCDLFNKYFLFKFPIL